MPQASSALLHNQDKWRWLPPRVHVCISSSKTAERQLYSTRNFITNFVRNKYSNWFSLSFVLGFSLIQLR
jgi:hypothetical protein